MSDLIQRLRTETCGWCSSGTCHDCKSLFNEAANEIERLLAGDFTREEIMNFCHKLPATVPECEHEAACNEWRRNLYHPGEPGERG